MLRNQEALARIVFGRARKNRPRADVAQLGETRRIVDGSDEGKRTPMCGGRQGGDSCARL